jgi:hypothetical protein
VSYPGSWGFWVNVDFRQRVHADVAVFDEREYRCFWDEEHYEVYLYWKGDEAPDEGFELVESDIWRRIVHVNDVDEVYNSKWVCEVQGEPAGVVCEVDGVLHLNYEGNSGPRAEEVGFRILERFVAVGSFTMDQVDNLREVRKRLVPWIPDSEEARLELSLDIMPDVLKSIGMGDDDVSVGAVLDDRWCIEKRGCGGWYVFYRENGSDYSLVNVKTEEEACYVLLGKMTLLRYSRLDE